jgi:predicted nucleic acid-binding protein
LPQRCVPISCSIDEIAGLADARRRNLRVIGTLGVLRAAAEGGLVDVPDLLTRLKDKNRPQHHLASIRDVVRAAFGEY